MSLKYRGPECGCCGGCVVETDDFNRANSTSLGGKWVELTGDAAIVGNELSMPDPDTVVRSTKPASGYFLKITPSSGVEIVLGFSTASTILPVYKLVVGAGTSTLTVMPGVAGSERTYDDVPVGSGDWFKVNVCGAGCGTLYFYDSSDNLVYKTGPWGHSTFGSGYPYPAFGTDDVGGVTFDDFQSFTATGESEECPPCVECWLCADTDTICIRVDGIRDVSSGGEDAIVANFEGNHVLTRVLGCLSVTQCQWSKFFRIGLDDYLITAGLGFISGQWALGVAFTLFSTGQRVALFSVDLGVPDPDCELWDDLQVDFVSATDSNFVFDFQLAEVFVTAGAICYYEESACCSNVTLPSSLFITITEDGLPFVTGEEVTGGVVGDGFIYDNMGGSFVICDPPDTPGVTVSGISGAITLSIDSCYPFSASGSKTSAGHLYEAVVTE